MEKIEMPEPHNSNQLLQSDRECINRSVNAYENVNGSYKYDTNPEIIWPKSELVSQLNNCTSDDSPKEIARLLELIFQQWPSIQGYWLYIAQTFVLRSIRWLLSDTIKQYRRGSIKKTPAHYFSNEIKFRTKKKSKRRRLTGTIGIYKSERRLDNV